MGLHCDEAGTSAHEPCVTVGGVVVHADKHHRALKAKLVEILSTVPEPLRDGLIFHAKDIWQGNNQFKRELWEQHGVGKEERRALVQKICSIPAEFGIPVIVGFVEKDQHETGWKRLLKQRPKSNLNPNRANYALAFGMCVVAAEAFIRERCAKDEVGQIVAEDTNEMLSTLNGLTL